MTTALLLLLGLLSAGAGAYTLFRDPNKSQPGGAVLAAVRAELQLQEEEVSKELLRQIAES